MTVISLDQLTELREDGLSIGEAVVCILSDTEGMDMKSISKALVFTPQAARHAKIRGTLKLTKK